MTSSIQVSWAQFEIPPHKPGYEPRFDPADCRDDSCPVCRSGCSIRQVPATAQGDRPPQCSDYPVRYASGEVSLKSTDLEVGGFGVPWGHTRSFSSQLSENTNIGNGFNWQVKEWGYLVFMDNGDVVVMGESLQAIWFTRSGNSFTADFSSRQTLTLDEATNVYLLQDLDGSVSQFSATTGSFQKRTDAGGNTLEVTSLSADGFIPGRVQRVYTNGGVTTTEQFLYEYDSTDPAEMLLESVTLRRQVDDGAWQNVLRATYAYYGAGEVHGAAGDLKTATKQTWGGSQWKDTGTTYYRYWLNSTGTSSSSSSSSSAGSDEPPHLVKFAVFPSSYDRIVADGDNPLTVSDTLLSQYADRYFRYDADRRVEKEMVQGGSRTFQFAMSESSFSDGYNRWKYKNVESLPGGNERIVYSNYAGQTMLRVFRSPNSSSSSSSAGSLDAGYDYWIEFWQYDSTGLPILHAKPSAVTGYDEQYADLLNLSGGSYEYLKDNDGFIETFSYHAPTSFVTARKIKKGQLGTEIKLREFEYIACSTTPPASSSSSSSCSSGGSAHTPVYFISKEIEYPSDTDQTLKNVTSYSYTWHPDTCQIKDRVTTLPVVSAAQNGSGVAATRRDYFDQYGNLTWQMDERGFITNLQYDVTTGAVTRQTRDVNTALATGVPAGWSTPSGGGLNLVTDFEHDDRGRIIQQLGPSHVVDLNGVATTVRTAVWNVYQDDTFEVWTAKGYENLGGATSSSSSSSAATGTGDYTLVNPVSITKRDADGRTLQQIQATRENTSGKLSAGDTFAQSSYTRWKTSQYTDCCFLASERVYHNIPTSGEGSSGTNYEQTDFGYTSRKIRSRHVTPGGTITRTVFDARQQPIEVYVGTDDSGASNTDPTGGGAAGNNMVLVTSHQYDNNQAGGDGNLTHQTQHVDASTSRVTAFTFDWRNRRTDTDGEIDFYQQVTYDNLNRVIKTERFDTTSAGNLIARKESNFDSRGRDYKQVRYGVDPATGTVGNALTSNTWFDASGNVIKSLPAGSRQFTKMTYDGVRRPVASYTGYDLDESTYAEAQDITGDTILQQTKSTYDDAGNAIQQSIAERYHNATGTGELNGPSGAQPKARITYTANYPDATGRQSATANFGTNGGASLTRPVLTPVRSDNILVNSTTYDSAGNMDSTTNPGGVTTCLSYDDAGRQTSTRMGCTTQSSSSSSSSLSTGGCPPSDDTNVTVNTTYNADGNIATITAVNAATGNQTTEYVYGSTLTDSDIASSMMKRAEIYPDSVDASDRITFAYNRQGQVTQQVDQAGTTHSFDYDLLGRQTQDRVTALASGVDGAVRRIESTYEVRGMKETLTSYSSATVGQGGVVNDVQFAYNNFGQLTHDYQSHSGAVNTGTTPKVQYGYEDGSANTTRPTTLTYPNGRELTYGYGAANSVGDAVSRIESIIDDDAGQTHLVDYSYLGSSTFVLSDYTEPGVHWTLVGTAGGDDPDTGDIYRGLDRFGRVKDNYWYNYSTLEDVDRIKYGYDANSNRLWRENVVARSYGKDFDEKYMYDLIDRLQNMGRGELDSNDNLSTKTFEQCWGLDATGNWKDFQQDDNGDGTWNLEQQRTANTVNEITNITETAGAAWATPAYSKAGNMTTVPQPADPAQSFTATYDAWNRLVKLEDSSATVAEYEYDGAKRRAIKKTYDNGVVDETRHMYYTEPEKWQVVEERVDSASDAERQFVRGTQYIDEIILRERDTTASHTLDERLYALRDANWSVTGVFDASSAIKERYAYSTYGSPMFLDALYVLKSHSEFDLTTQYSGYRVDVADRLYDVRNRVYSSDTGWLQRDPIGYKSGDVNLYRYVFNRPLNAVDPRGEVSWSWAGCGGGAATGGLVGAGTGALAGVWVFGIGAIPGAIAGGAGGAVLGCIGGGLVSGNVLSEETPVEQHAGVGAAVGVPAGVVGGVGGAAAVSVYTGAIGASPLAAWCGVGGTGTAGLSAGARDVLSRYPTRELAQRYIAQLQAIQDSFRPGSDAYIKLAQQIDQAQAYIDEAFPLR